MQIEEFSKLAIVFNKIFQLDPTARVEHCYIEYSLTNPSVIEIEELITTAGLTWQPVGERATIDCPFPILQEDSAILVYLDSANAKEQPALLNPGNASAALYLIAPPRFTTLDLQPLRNSLYEEFEAFLHLKNYLLNLADHHSETDGILIFFITGKSTLKLNIPTFSEIAQTLNSTKIRDILPKITEYWEKNPFQVIFKSILLQRLDSIPIQDRFMTVLKCLQSITDNCINNYELYIVSGKYRDNIDNFETKTNILFSEYRSLLEKLGNVILSIPITFAGTIFALAKIASSNIINLIILGVSFYGIINIIILALHNCDTARLLSDLKKTVNNLSMGNSIVKVSLTTKSAYLRRRLWTIRIISLGFIIIYGVLITVTILQLLPKASNVESAAISILYYYLNSCFRVC